MKKYAMRNALSVPWFDGQFYTVDGIQLAYKTIRGQDFICPYGELPMTVAMLERRGHTVVEPKYRREGTNGSL